MFNGATVVINRYSGLSEDDKQLMNNQNNKLDQASQAMMNLNNMFMQRMMMQQMAQSMMLGFNGPPQQQQTLQLEGTVDEDYQEERPTPAKPIQEAAMDAVYEVIDSDTGETFKLNEIKIDIFQDRHYALAELPYHPEWKQTLSDSIGSSKDLNFDKIKYFVIRLHKADGSKTYTSIYNAEALLTKKFKTYTPDGKANIKIRKDSKQYAALISAATACLDFNDNKKCFYIEELDVESDGIGYIEEIGSIEYIEEKGKPNILLTNDMPKSEIRLEQTIFPYKKSIYTNFKVQAFSVVPKEDSILFCPL